MVACRIIVSASVPVPFLWTLNLGFVIWIWDLDLGLDLGLTIFHIFLSHNHYNFIQPSSSSLIPVLKSGPTCIVTICTMFPFLSRAQTVSHWPAARADTWSPRGPGTRPQLSPSQFVVVTPRLLDDVGIWNVAMDYWMFGFLCYNSEEKHNYSINMVFANSGAC